MLQSSRVGWFHLALVSIFFYRGFADDCSAGEYLVDEACLKCPAGYVQPLDENRTQCEACPAGTFAPVEGMSACFDCSPNANSTEGAASCSYDPLCSPCTERSTIKIRAIVHGLETSPFWLRVKRGMVTAATQMNIDFSLTLFSRFSWQAMAAEIEEVMAEEEPDALILTLPDDDVYEAVMAAAQQTEVFTINTGFDISKSMGCRQHIGQNESAAGYQALSYFQNASAKAGIEIGACLVVHYSTAHQGIIARRTGFYQACLEQGLEVLDDLIVSSDDSDLREATIQAAMESHVGDGIGHAILLTDSSILAAASTVREELGSPANILFGVFDLPEGVDEGISDGSVAFAIDQQEWLQGYMAVVAATLRLGTGSAMAMDVLETGPFFLTAARSEEEAQRNLEGYPVCDCPWRGGYEATVQCGPEVDGITALSDCPLVDGDCTMPCVDIRQHKLRGIAHSWETSEFWYEAKAGAEQAANDLRLIDFEWNFFKYPGSGSSNSYTDELYLERILELADDDTVDGMFLTIKGEWLYDAITLAASRKPVVSMNAGSDVSANLNPEDGLLLHFVGQDEENAGLKAGERLTTAGARNVACLTFEITHLGHHARCRGAGEALAAIGGTHTMLDLVALGGSELSDIATQEVLVNAVLDDPSIDVFLCMSTYVLVAALSAAASLKEAKGYDLVVATFDISDEAVAGVADGSVSYMVGQVQYLQGYLSVLMLGVYFMSGQRLLEHIVHTGPLLVEHLRPRYGVCLGTQWTAEIVGEQLFPEVDGDFVYGFPVCEREGACTADGTFFNETLGLCRPCPAGSYKAEGMYECEACPAGTSTLGYTGSASCDECTSGLYSLEGASTCSFCPKGTFGNERGLSACPDCRAPFTTENIASQSGDQCMCPEGYYGVNGSYSGGGDCRVCPEAMTCPFGSHSEYLGEDAATRTQARQFLLVDYGYMTLLDNPLMPYRCLDKEACPGGGTATCSIYRDATSIACAVCLEGYYLDGSECLECDGSGIGIIILLGIVGIFGVTVVILLSTAGSHLRSQSSVIVVILASLLVTNFQALSVFENLAFEWFEPVATLLTWTSTVISIDVQMMKLQCFFRFGTWVKYALLQTIVPLGIPFCYVVLLARKHCPIVKYRNSEMGLGQEIVTAIGSLLGMFFIKLVMSTLTPFICYEHPGALSSVKSNPEVLCSWTGQHASMVGVGVVSFLVVPLPFLANAVFVTWRYKRSLAIEARKTVLRKYRFLFFRFKAHAYYYGIILVLRSLSICLVPVLARNDAGLQLFVLSILVVLTTQLQCLIQPWRAPICNVVDATMSLCLLALLMVAALVSEFSVDGAALQVLGFGSILAMLVLGLCTLVYVTYRVIRRAPFYDVFLCHHKEGAAAQVRHIKTVLAAQHYIVFIDSDDLIDLDRLFDTIKNNISCFVAYLTKSTLRRAWCCGELVSAKQAKVKTRTVITASFTAPTDVQLENLSSYVVGKDSALANYGISMVDVKIAMESLLDPSIPSISLHECPFKGSHRFAWVANRLIRRTYSPSNHVDEVSQPSILVSASHTDDEAIAAAGYLTMKLHQLLLERSSTGEVRCLIDETHQISLKLWLQQAKVMVIVLSATTLSSSQEIEVIARSVRKADKSSGEAFSFIPVHLMDFNFPSKEFFEVGLLEMALQDELEMDVMQLTSSVKTFFKCISVQFPMSASEEVLSAQVHSIFARIPLKSNWKSSDRSGNGGVRRISDRISWYSSVSSHQSSVGTHKKEAVASLELSDSFAWSVADFIVHDDGTVSTIPV